MTMRTILTQGPATWDKSFIPYKIPDLKNTSTGRTDFLKSPFLRLAELIIDHPRYVAVASAIILIVALFGMGFVTMATGSDTYLDKDTKRGMLLDDYTETFQSNSILVLIEADGVLTPPVLAYIDRLETEIAKEQNVNSVSGITDLLKSANGGVLPASSADITRAEQRIPLSFRALCPPGP
jgi:predicted RND superfamily exporter protein